MDDRQEHFNEKKEHTKIKHKLLEETFRTSLSIANNMSSTCKSNSNKVYTYFDLFSGKGTFDDGEKGSPIITLEILRNHTHYKQNNFEQLHWLAIDKETNNISALDKNISENYKDIDGEILTYTYNGDWADHSQEISNKLKQSNWGFVFADPFSTELDIKQFCDIFCYNTDVKDLMIFYNYRTLSRQKGRGHSTDKNRVKKVLGLSEEEFNSSSGLSSIFEKKIKEHLNSIKDFVVGVALPVTKNGKVIKADYFYLVLATNSVTICDTFFKTYNEILNSFGMITTIESFLYSEYIIEQINKNRMNLYNLYYDLTLNFISWKGVIDGNVIVPTTEKIIQALNDLFSRNIISYNAPDKYLNKTQKNKGKLNKSNIKRMSDMKSITISYIGD